MFDREEKTARELPSKFDRWVDELVWAPDSKTIYFTGADAGIEPIYKTEIAGPGAGEVGMAALGGGEYGDVRVSADGKMFVATFMKAVSPSFIVAVPNDEHHSAIQLSHLNDTLLSALQLSDMESFRFSGAGGTSVEGFVVRPPNFDEGKKYPVKFLIHGGPQGAWGDEWSYRWNAELMAADGYVVVMVNPRGSTGYGQAFIDGVNGDWGGKPYIDLMKGLDAAEAKFPFIDKARECALGASYGGYMADWVLTHTDRFKCIVTHDGMFNPAAAYGDTEELWFNEWEFRRGPATGAAARDKAPGQPWRYQSLPAEQDPFRKWSPMLHIKNAKTPTLVIHSQRDYRLDVSEGFQLFTALQRLGISSKMLYFPDEGHWVLKPQNSKLWYETVGDWCDRWTKTGKYAEAK
jgi:dipeptidyl aminopeptidase/acylaminoacyl peptidase